MRKNRAVKIVEEATSTYNTIASHFSATRFNAGPFLKEITNDVSDDAMVLDIGCGNGRLLEVLPKGLQYTGIDVSEKLLEMAKELHPSREDDFKIFDGLKLPFKDNSFSYIYMLASFHHMPKPLQQVFINECKRVLNKDGKIVMTVWHLWRKPFLGYLFQSLQGKIVSRDLDIFDIYIPWKNKDGHVQTKRYFHMFRKNEIVKLYKIAGFNEIQVSVVKLYKQKNYLLTAIV